MQYHVELESDTVDNWGKIPAYKQALENALGPSGLDDIRSDTNRDMDEFLRNARQLYTNFMVQCKS